MFQNKKRNHNIREFQAPKNLTYKTLIFQFIQDKNQHPTHRGRSRVPRVISEGPIHWTPEFRNAAAIYNIFCYIAGVFPATERPFIG